MTKINKTSAHDIFSSLAKGRDTDEDGAPTVDDEGAVFSRLIPSETDDKPGCGY